MNFTPIKSRLFLHFDIFAAYILILSIKNISIVVVGMRRLVKKQDNLDDDLAYILWQAEVNKEIQSFWKSIAK